jgi:hypothetical protein
VSVLPVVPKFWGETSVAPSGRSTETLNGVGLGEAHARVAAQLGKNAARSDAGTDATNVWMR